VAVRYGGPAVGERQGTDAAGDDTDAEADVREAHF